MKKILLGVSVLSLLTLTGCGGSHGSYDLKCTGDHAMTADICFTEDYIATHDSSSEPERNVSKIYLCGDISSGKGEYYFYFEDDKIFLELEEEYNEEFTDKYYEDMEDALEEFASQGQKCTLDKKDGKAIFKCEKYDTTKDFKDYNSKDKMKELMEDLKFKCE
jgi:hypothetical protein